MRVRMSVTVTGTKAKRKGDTGIIEAIDLEADKVSVRFDTPDPTGELVTYKAADLTVLPGQ